MESTTVKLYSLNYGNVRTYLQPRYSSLATSFFPNFFISYRKEE